MSIRKRRWADGKEAWQVDVTIGSRRIREQRPTKSEAQALELELRKQAREGTIYADGRRILLGSLVASFFEHLDQRHARGRRMTRAHLHHTKAHVTNFIIGGAPIRRRHGVITFQHGLGKFRLHEVTPKTVERFQEYLVDTGMSMKTVKAITNSLSLMLEFARRQNLIAVNPAHKVFILDDRNAKAKRKIVAPTKLLVRRLEESALPAFALYLKFAALTGVRAGEQRGLRWRCVNLVRKSIRIETRVDRWGEEDGQGPKTEASNRDIPLAEELVIRLRAWREQSAYSSEDDLVFPGREGKPRNHESVLIDNFYPLVKKVLTGWAGSEPRPPRPRWHDLRHFAVSCWIEAGLPPKAIQEFAGHSSLSTTMDIYGHLFPSEDHHSAMNAIAKRLSAQ